MYSKMQFTLKTITCDYYLDDEYLRYGRKIKNVSSIVIIELTQKNTFKKI